MDRIKINVGGSVFEIFRKELMQYPDTLLGSLSTKVGSSDDVQSMFFFSRNPETFNNILDFYRHGKLHFASGNCGAALHDEIDYWQLPLDAICECCVQEYFRYEKEMEQIKVLKAAFEESDLTYDAQQVLRSRRVYIFNAIWKFLDQPYSSKFAQVFNIVFLLVVIMSALSFILSTNKEFRDVLIDFNTLEFLVKHSELPFFQEIDLNNSKEVLFSTSEAIKELRDIDFACALFFTVEVLILALKHSCKELCLLFLSFLIASIYFAFIVYFAEYKTDDSFETMQIGIWWSIVTMTTVGYGDVFPKSGLGYAVGTVCAFVELLL
ncbi:hypothetical protein FSP39_020654 [Pinctada imbricata]|uniref:BTB domain-containing protein n=1 Tax=Pinctada imbricata TaxID=66713 RepID=A0AA89BW85_PINIB|nr:hypothetical protein FSP39_020654 [Pinctada imbricata]